MTEKKLFVTEPALPPLEELMPYLERIWASKTVTNGGAIHTSLESALAAYLRVENLSLVANGTLALMLSLRALNLSGSVITTPYTFVATSHALLWSHLRPIFVDVDCTTCNIDPAQIESAIQPDTSAILAVHCYGNPCDVLAIEDIAARHGLRVIYDAAHAFGVQIDERSLLSFGDLSTVSFHATKVYNTIEGGCIVTESPELKVAVDYLRNFGFAGETKVVSPGINAKMSELHAAVGLAQLPYIDEYLSRRLAIASHYSQRLRCVQDIRLLVPGSSVTWNAAYFPVFLEGKVAAHRDQVYEAMKARSVLGRRYFYPLVSSLPCYSQEPSALPRNLPVANELSASVICLPIYADMTEEDADRASDVFLSALRDEA